MKTGLLLVGLALTALLSAADASKILLIGSSISVEDGNASGATRAIVGDMSVTADGIAFEKQKNVLKCEGAVTIRIAGHVVTARDCAIQLSSGEKKLYLLSQGSIQISPANDTLYYPASPTDLIGRSSDREKVIQDFRSRSQREEAPDKAPQPNP